MRTISVYRPAALPLLMLLIMCAWTPEISGQQYFQSNDANYLSLRDVSGNTPVTLSTFTAERYTGYNEIEWASLLDNNTSKYIVEFSTNGTDYQTAATIMPGSPYSYKHYINDNRPTLYRLRAEQLDGKYYYSGSIALAGQSLSPVKVYPTIVTGNHFNLNASWPVERITIARQDGSTAFAKDINGQKDYISVNIPEVGKGMYFVTSFGNGWVTTDKILIP